MDSKQVEADLYHLRTTRGLSEKQAAEILGIPDTLADEMALQYRVDERKEAVERAKDLKQDSVPGVAGDDFENEWHPDNIPESEIIKGV